MRPQQRSLRARRLQAGLTLIELSIVASILTVMTVIAAGKLMQEINDAAAQATGTYLLTIKGAMDAFLVKNYEQLVHAEPISEVLDPLAPTLSELRGAGFLNGGFPERTPFNQAVAIRIERSGTCPGSACRLDALVHTITPLQTAGSSEPNSDLVAQVVLSSAGFGGAAYMGDPGHIRGATYTVDNPMGATTGIVAVVASLDTTQFHQFVRIRDSRNPDLQGELSVQGNVQLHGTLAMRNATGIACVSADGSGLLTLRCAGALNAKTGLFTADDGSVVQINPATGVVASQRIYAAQGLATSRASVFDGSDLHPTIRVASGQMLLATSNGLALTVMGQDLVGHGGVSAARLGLREVGVANTACSTRVSSLAGSQAEFARSPSGGLLVCAEGTWRALAELAIVGTACSPNGAFATEADTGAGLVCRLGVWMRADDLLSSYVMLSTQVVTTMSMVPKPVCGQLGSTAGTPLIYLLPQIESSTAAAFTRKAIEMGDYWQIQLLDYDGNALGGPPRAIAQIYCKY